MPPKKPLDSDVLNLLQLFARRILRWFAVFGIAICIAAIVVYCRLDFFGRVVADHLLANAAITTRGTMPVTGGQIPYSSDDVQILGGRGEGLSCSLPPEITKRAFPDERGRAPIGLEMQQACAMHDYCYRHGSATYGYTQADCDFMLQEHAFQLCYFIERARNVDQVEDSKSKCIRDARLVTLGVRIGGSDSFRSVNPSITALSKGHEDEIGVDGGASTYFEYDPYPVRSQSYTVFRIADAPNLDEKQGRQKTVYVFSLRPSGVFLSVAPVSNNLWQKAILPGDPRYLVNAPLVAETMHNGRSEDWFVWWQRRSLGETGGRLLGIAPGRATSSDWRCLYFASMPDIMRDSSTLCPNNSAFFVVVLSGRSDGDAFFSEVLPSHLGRVTEDTIWLSALQTPSCRTDRSNGLCFLDIAVDVTSKEREQLQIPLRIGDEITPNFPGKPQFESDLYRNFVGDPIILKTPGRHDPTIIWVRRDENYKSSALLRRIGIDRRRDRPQYYRVMPLRSILLSENYESGDPRFVVGRTSKHPFLAGLLSASNKSGHVRLAQWHLPPFAGKDTVGELAGVDADLSKCDPGLENTWLARPPIAIPLDQQNTAIILSRAIDSSKENASHSLEVGFFSITSDGGCSAFQNLAKISLDRLIPIATANVRAGNVQRLELLRKTPILAGDLDGDRQLEIIFPAVNKDSQTVEIARIDRKLPLTPRLPPPPE